MCAVCASDSPSEILMLQSLSYRSVRQAAEPSFREFVFVIVIMMAMGSWSIDNLLPAFEPIRQSFGASSANEMQLILTAYMAGFALMQVVYGPLSDRFGRRPILMFGLVFYTAGTVLAIVSANYETLLVARVVQGLGAAAARVLAVAIVRDRFAGREMARVMSLTMMIFIIVPVFAPATGSLILLFGSWRLIFVSMLALALLVVVWFGLRMPETLHPEYRRALSVKNITRSVGRIVHTRVSIGYATALGLSMASLMTYLGSSQEIFQTETYHLGNGFVVVFGLIATCMGLASFANSRLVRLGMRRMSHFGLCGFIAVAALLLIQGLYFGGRPPLLLFVPCMGLAHFLLSLTMPNFNTLAMEPLGDIAGTASSFVGGYMTLVGAIGGYIFGQAFNGTMLPLAAAYLGLSLTCLAVVLWTERGRLFTAHPRAGA
jgi:DHA1 family bicyclomycin/chloramphenicol resistance-like MFS transporter